MKHRDVRLTDEALVDIDSATQFYEEVVVGLGQYFFDSIIADLEALEFSAVSTSKIWGITAALQSVSLF